MARQPSICPSFDWETSLSGARCIGQTRTQRPQRMQSPSTSSGFFGSATSTLVERVAHSSGPTDRPRIMPPSITAPGCTAKPSQLAKISSADVPLRTRRIFFLLTALPETVTTLRVCGVP